MYGTFNDELQPFGSRENLQKYYRDSDSFVLSISSKNNIKDLQNLEDSFDFSALNQIHAKIARKTKNLLKISK